MLTETINVAQKQLLWTLLAMFDVDTLWTLSDVSETTAFCSIRAVFAELSFLMSQWWLTHALVTVRPRRVCLCEILQ